MVWTGALKKADGNYRNVTWGEILGMTPRFLYRYCPQMLYAVIPTDWLNDHGKAPNGLDMAALTRDLAIVSGQPDPGPAPQPTPPPFQPDPVVLAYQEWESQVNAYCTSEYAKGNVAGVAAEQAVLSQYSAQLAAYMQDSTKALPPLPALPGGGV
jgi:hypothetical protein